MGLRAIIRGWVYKLVLRSSAKRKTFDIIEVRTKDLSLTYINMETDVRISNSFFLPFTILSIETDIINSAGTKVGKMNYNQPKRLGANSTEVFTTRSKMSNITAFFNMLQHILSIPISLRSVGTARIKFLGMTFDLPVDDTFEVHPTQVKLTEELSEEEKQRRAEKREKEKLDREQRRKERAIGKATSEQRLATSEEVHNIPEENTLEIELREEGIKDIELEITNNTSASSALDDITKTNIKADEEKTV